jgi:hypothetical protein
MSVKKYIVIGKWFKGDKVEWDVLGEFDDPDDAEVCKVKMELEWYKNIELIGENTKRIGEFIISNEEYNKMLIMESEIEENGNVELLKDKFGDVIKEGYWVDVQGVFEKIGKNKDGTLYFYPYNKKELVSTYSSKDMQILKHQKK